jgi:hypothetical protein
MARAGAFLRNFYEFMFSLRKPSAKNSYAALQSASVSARWEMFDLADGARSTFELRNELFGN